MLKPLDTTVLLYIVSGDLPARWSQTQLAADLRVSQSSVHRSLAQLERSRLLRDGRPRHGVLRQFILHGIPYAYPVEVGPPTRGFRTAHEAAGWGAPLYRDEPVVWSSDAGDDEGCGINPLHPEIPPLAQRAPMFRRLMALVEIARLGAKRDVTRVARELKQMWEVKL